MLFRFITSGRADDDQLQSLYPTAAWEHFGSSPCRVTFNRGAFPFSRGLRRVWSVVIAKKKAAPPTT